MNEDFWWQKTRCSTPGLVTDDDLFPEPWQREPTVDMIRCCNLCPVRVQCLDLANKRDPTGEDHGVYGGLTPYQRRQTLRAMKRARCPACHGTETKNARNIQVCVSCGQSWTTQLTKKLKQTA